MPELINRNLIINGRRSSMRLEPELWDAFVDICRAEGLDHVGLMKRIMETHKGGSHTSTVRVYLLNHYRRAVTQEAA